MNEGFLELKTTENQLIYIRKSEVGAFEIVPASARVEGHIKIFVGGVKFLVQIAKEELLKQLNG